MKPSMEIAAEKTPWFPDESRISRPGGSDSETPRLELKTRVDGDGDVEEQVEQK